ncbi:MAG TPA: DEAD/DEAH box helicase [Rugosimonospora sp.]|jgi:superfamily II DNA/RNA helicase
MTLSAARPPFADPNSFPSVFDQMTGASGQTDAAPNAAASSQTDAAPNGATSRQADAASNDTASSQVDAAPNAAASGEADAVSTRTDAAPAPAGFAGFRLPEPLVRTLTREGITQPFPIQTATIPDALAGRDVLGRGQTGSGKTLAFGLPLLARIAAGGKSAPGRPRALILVPTRELAMQVNDALAPLARSVGVFNRTAVGGTSYDRQIRDLRRGVDVLVATPGRLADLIERRECSLAEIEISVLDEADQMADMGFLPDVTALLEQTPAGAQRLLFSATLDGDVDTLVSKFMTDPVTHEVDPPRANVSTMEHHLLLIPPTEKLSVISRIAARQGRTIMFVRTQLAVDRLAGQLAQVGVRAGALHGGKTQAVRTRTLAEFREGRTSVLVATDVAARGIHVDGVSLVVHVDPPKDPKDYLHRAGRTARAGEAGTVVTLVLPRQRASTFALLEKAGVSATRTSVRPEAPELVELTGAREPSGVPVPPEEPKAPRRDGRRNATGTGGYHGGGGHHGDRPSGYRDNRRREDRRYGDDRRNVGHTDERRPADDRRYGDGRPRRRPDRRPAA